MKIWTCEHVFEHPWESVIRAAWRKYPNPTNPSVKSIDVLERRVSDDGVLHVGRLFTSEWSIPRWVSNLIGLENPTHSFEQWQVDPNAKEMRLTTLNCTNFVRIEEKLVYRPHPALTDKTLLEQETTVTVRGVPLINFCEGLIVSAFRSNTQKGFEWVIGNVRREYDDLANKLTHEYAEIAGHFAAAEQQQAK